MLAWLLALAYGHPVVLPPDEDPAAWASVLELVGLEVAAPTPGEVAVRLQDAGTSWRVMVRGPGGERTATVPVPATPAAREATAQVAASLVRELEAPALPPLPALPEVSEPKLVPKPTPARVEVVEAPEPAPVVAPEPSPAIDVALPAIDEVPSPTPQPAETLPAPEPPLPSPSPEVAVPPPEDVATSDPAPRGPQPAAEPTSRATLPSPSKLAPFAWGGLGLHLRASELPSVSLALWGGAVGRRARVGLGVDGSTATALTDLDVDARVQRTSGWLGGWARFGPLEPGLVGGAQWHRYQDVGPADGVLLPTAGLSLAAFPQRNLRIEGRVHRDLRRVEIFVGDDRLRVAEPWSWRLGVSWVPWARAGGAGGS